MSSFRLLLILGLVVLCGCSAPEERTGLRSIAPIYRAAPGPVSQPSLTSGPLVNSAPVRIHDQDWQRAERELHASSSELDAKLRGITSRSLRSYVMRSGTRRGKEIALTFDDGPHPASTTKLLKILADQHVPATFFIVGFMALKHPALVAQIQAGGHEIGNHTYSHPALSKLSPLQVLTEYQAANDAVQQITGTVPKYCRPPGGRFNRTVLQAAAFLHLTTVLWTVDPLDYENPDEELLLDKMMAGLRPGGIILLHDGSASMLAILSRFIEMAKANGFKFVSLDELRGSPWDSRNAKWANPTVRDQGS